MKTRITITLLRDLVITLSLALGIHSVAQAEDVFTYIHTDHLGNPIAYTNEQGVVIERRYYLPDGTPLNDSDVSGDEAGYTGHIHDSDTGLVYMQARYYDPVLGRFLSTDPVTFSPDRPEYFNRYWYAGGNPMNNTDPDGRCYAPPVTAGCVVVGGLTIITLGVVKYYTDPVARDGIEGLVEKINEAADEVGQVVFNESGDSTDTARGKISEGTKPARGRSGEKGEREGTGGREGRDRAFDDIDGTERDTGKDGVRVKELSDGGRVEAHDSTKSADYPRGTPSIKVQNKDGDVIGTARYPEE